jgi:hypothetical protein
MYSDVMRKKAVRILRRMERAKWRYGPRRPFAMSHCDIDSDWTSEMNGASVWACPMPQNRSPQKP